MVVIERCGQVEERFKWENSRLGDLLDMRNEREEKSRMITSETVLTMPFIENTVGENPSGRAGFHGHVNCAVTGPCAQKGFIFGLMLC